MFNIYTLIIFPSIFIALRIISLKLRGIKLNLLKELLWAVLAVFFSTVIGYEVYLFTMGDELYTSSGDIVFRDTFLSLIIGLCLMIVICIIMFRQLKKQMVWQKLMIVPLFGLLLLVEHENSTCLVHTMPSDFYIITYPFDFNHTRNAEYIGRRWEYESGLSSSQNIVYSNFPSEKEAIDSLDITGNTIVFYKHWKQPYIMRTFLFWKIDMAHFEPVWQGWKERNRHAPKH
jgi:hypothetical protein